MASLSLLAVSELCVSVLAWLVWWHVSVYHILFLIYRFVDLINFVDSIEFFFFHREGTARGAPSPPGIIPLPGGTGGSGCAVPSGPAIARFGA